MVAVFTGVGAGFERGSGAALGAGGLLGAANQGRGGEGVFLNAATGNLLLQRQDEYLVGRGPDVAIARTYNSLGEATHDDNGDLWRQSSDRRVLGLTGTLNTAGSTVKRLSADGSLITYTYNTWADGAYYRATDGAGAHDKLVHNSGVWTWTDGSTQITETYSAAQASGQWRIAAQTDTDDNAVSFAYVAGADKLKSVTTSANGVAELVEYQWGVNDAENHITQVTVKFDHDLSASTQHIARSRTTYGYDGSNRLTSVTVDLTPDDTGDGSSYTTTYTYDGASKRVATISQTDGSSLQLGYDGSGRVISLTQSVAGSDTRRTELSYGSGQTSIKVYQQEYVDASTPSLTMTLFFDANSQLTRIVAPPALSGATPQETHYAYDGDGNVASVIAKSGATTLSTVSYQYDARGNVTQITDANGNVTTRTYTAKNRIALETRTGSADASASTPLYTRYVYDDENHVRFAISPEGLVTEYAYTSAGELKLTRAFTAAAHRYAIGQTIPALSAMQTWVTDRGDISSAQAAENVYDLRGNLKETHRYGVATSGGLGATVEGTAKTIYVYDQHGRLRSRQVESQALESFVYDGLDRLILSTDLAGGTTTIMFADAARTTTTITLTSSGAETAQSFITVATYNKAGELISRTESGSTAGDGRTYTNGGTATYLYDKNGRLRVATDASARTSYFLFDDVGRKVADIGHDGQLVEYRYDQQNRLTTTVRYQNQLTAAQLASLANPDSDLELGASLARPLNHAYDIWQWSVYDTGGRLIQTIMGDGAVTSYQYDQADRLTATLGYYNKLADVAPFKTTAPTAVQTLSPHAKDVVIRSFYDRDGRVIGGLSAEGALSRLVYDSAGRKIQDIIYADLTDPAQRTAGTFVDLLASVTPEASQDVTNRYVYDGQGLLRFSIDALGYVTQYVYWEGTNTHATGLVRKLVAHAAPLSALGDYNYAAVKAAVAALASASDNRVGYSVYNNRAQLRYTIDASGAVTQFSYDAAGRVTKSVQYANLFNTASIGVEAQWEANLTAWAGSNGAGARITRNYYAERGELRYVIDAEGYVTRNDYDTEGRLSDVYRYAASVAAQEVWTINEVHDADKGASVRTQYGYDNLGRLADVYDANGVRHSTWYYGNGQMGWRITAFAQGMDEQRVTWYAYDQAGKVTHEYSATSEGANGAWLGSTQTLIRGGELLVAPGSRYRAQLTREGELRVYHDGEVIWSNGVRETVNGASYRLVAENNGNAVIYRDLSGQASVAIWSTQTSGAGGAFFFKIDDTGAFGLHAGTAPTSQGLMWSAPTTGVAATDPNASYNVITATYVYDGLGNVALVKDARDATTSFSYDKVGRVTKRTDALGNETEFLYDAFGRGVKLTDALDNVSYTYFDRLGRVALAIDAQGLRHRNPVQCLRRNRLGHPSLQRDHGRHRSRSADDHRARARCNHKLRLRQARASGEQY